MSQRKPYTIWKIGENEYKLRLTTRQICDVEEKLGVNLLKIFMPKPGEQFNLPPLKVMLVILHGAMQKFNHGISMDDVYTINDIYIDSGKSQADLMAEVLLPLFEASGFIPKDKEDEEVIKPVMLPVD